MSNSNNITSGGGMFLLFITFLSQHEPPTTTLHLRASTSALG